MNKKKLIINVATCDTRNVSEETLETYKNVQINAASIITNKSSKDLLSRYNVRMNSANVLNLPDDAELQVHNGNYEISSSTTLLKPTVLTVNGALDIKKGAEKALENYISISVNGTVSYPSDLQNKLPQLNVNGTTECYPADSIRVSRSLLLDKIFILRAKQTRYYAHNKVIISDQALDINKLVDKKVKFITKKAVIAEPLLEQALPLFDDETQITVIPTGYSYIRKKTLDDSTVKKHGDKLYVDGDFTINLESEEALNSLSYIKVTGSVFIVGKLVDQFRELDADYNSLKVIKDNILKDKGILNIDKKMLDALDGGITLVDCGIVQLSPDITPEEINEKLQFDSCGCIYCNTEQRSAVELVSEHVGQIIDSEFNLPEALGGNDAQDLYDDDTVVINSAHYEM